jgi:hypothetical protein
MSKECARSLRKGCGGHAAHIDEHPVVDSRSERMLMGLLRDGPSLGSGVITGNPEVNGYKRITSCLPTTH